MSTCDGDRELKQRIETGKVTGRRCLEASCIAPQRRTILTVVLLAFVLLPTVGCQPDAQRAEVALLGTTDVHGYLMPWAYSEARSTDSSLVQLATLVDSIREAEPRVVLLDSGDFLQGSELTDYLAATGIDSVHPIIAAMNEMEYDAVALGNHEYNHGIEFLHRALADGTMPFLSANTYHAGTDSLVYSPYTIVERGGISIGILGLNTPGVAVWDRGHVEGRLEFRDMIASAERWLAEMRRSHSPDLVVVAAHTGIDPGSTYGEDQTGVMQEAAAGRLAREVEGIDVIFAGHTAGPVPPREIDGTLVTHAGHWGETLAVIHVTLEQRATDGWNVVGKEGTLREARTASPDPEVKAVVRPAHEATQAWLEEELAYTPDRWSATESRVRDTPVADLINEAMRRATGAELASTAIFDPSVSFGPGPVTRRHVLALYRYPNRLKSVQISGEALKSYLEWSARYYNGFPAEKLVSDSVLAFNYDVVSGARYRIDLRKPVGERVQELQYQDAPVEADDTLSLAVNSYRQAGGGGFSMLSDLPVTQSGNRLVSEVIADFVRRHDTLRTEDVFRQNWSLEPEAAERRLLETQATLPRY